MYCVSIIRDRFYFAQRERKFLVDPFLGSWARTRETKYKEKRVTITQGVLSTGFREIEICGAVN